MSNKAKNILIVALCALILGSLALASSRISAARNADVDNPNVTLVTTPDQEDFEVHEEWTIPATEPIDYGVNLAFEKEVKQNGQTDIYNCRNITDGDRFTYWEGKKDAYPNEVTIEMGEPTTMSCARILLNPRQNWGARTQEVEVLISDDGENFTSVFPKTSFRFDPMADNSVYLEFDAPVTARYIRFAFYSNTGAVGGQAAEIEIYEKTPKE